MDKNMDKKDFDKNLEKMIDLLEWAYKKGYIDAVESLNAARQHLESLDLKSQFREIISKDGL